MIIIYKSIGVNQIFISENPSGNELNSTWKSSIKPIVYAANKKGENLLILVHYTGHGIKETDGMTSLVLNE